MNVKPVDPTQFRLFVDGIVETLTTAAHMSVEEFRQAMEMMPNFRCRLLFAVSAVVKSASGTDLYYHANELETVAKRLNACRNPYGGRLEAALERVAVPV